MLPEFPDFFECILPNPTLELVCYPGSAVSGQVPLRHTAISYLVQLYGYRVRVLVQGCRVRRQCGGVCGYEKLE